MGQIDRYGHEHGIRLARHLDGELRDIVDRISSLLNAGWQQVTVITDHGWLLLPGGLPKAELPQYFTEPRKGRCARIKPGEPVDQQTVPWHWDEDVRVAVPYGIGCYQANEEYEHGGLSPQECVVPILTVRKSSDSPSRTVSITTVKWTGLRCNVEVEGDVTGCMVDIRDKPGDPTTSVLVSAKPVGDDGSVALFARDEHEGRTVTVVVIGPDGALLAQTYTTVGG